MTDASSKCHFCLQSAHRWGLQAVLRKYLSCCSMWHILYLRCYTHHDSIAIFYLRWQFPTNSNNHQRLISHQKADANPRLIIKTK